MTGPATFTCPDCGAASPHPDDVANCYCGNCHAFKNESYMPPRCMEPSCPQFGSYDLCPQLKQHQIPPALR